MIEVLALTRTNIEGALVVVAAMVLFVGSLYVLLSAVFGNRMGYLVTATGLFAFMIIMSLLWIFGSPGSTPKLLGPKGEPPAWKGLAAARQLKSTTHPIFEQYPGAPWKDPKAAKMPGEVEPATTAFQEFLAEEASIELREAEIEGEIAATEFQVTDLRFAKVDDTTLAVGRAFASAGGPEVLVAGFKDPGDVATPSYAFLIASILGFALHVPLLDRAERRRKEILTGGDQAPWRGPA